MGTSDMVSAPAATPELMRPPAMPSATDAMAALDEMHAIDTVCAGTPSGSDADSDASRAKLDVFTSWMTVPSTTAPAAGGGEAGGASGGGGGGGRGGAGSGAAPRGRTEAIRLHGRLGHEAGQRRPRQLNGKQVFIARARHLERRAHACEAAEARKGGGWTKKLRRRPFCGMTRVAPHAHRR